ncbi:hypothetical protein M758_7G138500 [Ceratodon purpureus]|uniref:Secreted protein n=1 Tax=Ceratodon purpureus TaxID=3225 RepID=A0A8T0HBF7_CERPU|nr:hypothetical protein KC19_7G139700 [Ceratodon purpureus]KAG0611405.1 hypothetical protein M758_7G138500 [Ceratodon purpureus]
MFFLAIIVVVIVSQPFSYLEDGKCILVFCCPQLPGFDSKGECIWQQVHGTLQHVNCVEVSCTMCLPFDHTRERLESWVHRESQGIQTMDIGDSTESSREGIIPRASEEFAAVE